MTSRNSARVGGRATARHTVTTATTTTAAKNPHDTADTVDRSPPHAPHSTDTAPITTAAAASTADVRGPSRCGSPRTPVRASSSRSGSTLVRCTAAPSAAPAVHAHQAANAGSGAESVASDGKTPKLTRNGTIDQGVDLSPAL
jgi:hypothetical protein